MSRARTGLRRPCPRALVLGLALLALALLAGPASQAAPAWAQDYTAPRPQDAPWAGPGRAPQVAPASQAPQASQAAPPLEAFGGARGEGSLVSQERAPRPAGGDQESLPVAGEQPPATPAGLDLLDQGEFAAAAGRFEEAERIWRKALAQRPDWPEVKRRLAELPARRANFRPQLTEQHERREARLALVQGISDFNARRYREAEANILAFLRVFPEDAEGLYYLDLARAQGQAVGVGRLKVFCAPEAQVLLDGRPVGQTPLSLPAAPGVRRVEVRAHGGGQGQEVRVPAGGEAQVSFTLLGGFLAVNAQPWGQVYLDGKQVGQTPITLENLVLGPHTVTVRNPELPEQSQRVVLPLGETVSVQFNLEGR